MFDPQAEFLRYFLTLLVEWLRKQPRARLDTLPMQGRTPRGYIARGKGGQLKLYPKQAELVPPLDGSLDVLTVPGFTGAVGDGRRYRPPHVTPKRGGGAFPVPMPHQPAAPPLIAVLHGVTRTLKDTPQPLPTWAATFQQRGDGEEVIDG